MYHFFGLVNYGKVAKPEEIHFQEPEFFKFGHGKLGYGGVVKHRQGNVLVHRAVGNNHARRVFRGVARHTLYLFGKVDKFFYGGVAVVYNLKVGRFLKRLVKCYIKFVGYKFCHLIANRIGDVHNPANISYGIFCRHGTKGNNLGYVIFSVLVYNVVNNLAAAFYAKIDVNIGHRNALGV